MKTVKELIERYEDVKKVFQEEIDKATDLTNGNENISVSFWTENLIEADNDRERKRIQVKMINRFLNNLKLIE